MKRDTVWENCEVQGEALPHLGFSEPLSSMRREDSSCLAVPHEGELLGMKQYGIRPPATCHYLGHWGWVGGRGLHSRQLPRVTYMDVPALFRGAAELLSSS